MALLPTAFGDLEQFAPRWCLATEAERWAERHASTIDDLEAFYNASLPRVEEAIAYCDKFSLDEMPDDAVALLRLVYSFILVSFPVELWHQPQVPDTGATSFDRLDEPLP